MNCLKQQGTSVNSVIIKHIQQLIKVCKLTQKLHRITQQLYLSIRTKTSKHITVDNSLQNSQNDQKEHRQMGFIDILLEKIIVSKADFVYYQRVASKQHHDRLLSYLLKELEDVCKNRRHQFYRSRRVQVRLITQIVGFIDQIENKLKRCLKDVKIQFPTQFVNYIKSTVTKTKMIQYRPISKTSAKYIVKVNIHQTQNQTSGLTQDEKKNSVQVNIKEARQTVTNATTRPSSTGKSATSGGIKFHLSIPLNQGITKPNLNYNLSSRIRHTRKSHNRERSNDKLKTIRSQRAKTAKVGFDYFYFPKNLDKEDGQKKIFKSQLEIEEKPKEKAQQSKYFDSALSSIQIKQPVKQDEKKLLNQAKFQALIGKQSKNSRSARRRNGLKQNNYTNGINTVKAELSTLNAEKVISQEAHQLMSSSVRNYDKMHKGRTFQSHQNLLGLYQVKTQKKPRLNRGQVKRVRTSRKKITRNSKVFQIEKISEEEGYCEQQHKNVVLLIKPSQQTLKQSKSNFYSMQKTYQDQRISIETQRKKIAKQSKMKIQSQLKRIRESDEFFLNKKMKINNYLNVQDFKLSLQQINKIRAEFVQCRKQNNYLVVSQNLQHSSFFIQQDILSHRQNMRFQTYLKKLKQTKNKENLFQPFNIETEIQQLNNLKRQQGERGETFRGEGLWIKHRFYQSKQIDQFKQLGLDVMKKCVV